MPATLQLRSGQAPGLLGDAGSTLKTNALRSPSIKEARVLGDIHGRLLSQFVLHKCGEFGESIALQGCAYSTGENIGDQRFCFGDDQRILVAMENDVREVWRDLLGAVFKREAGLAADSKYEPRIEASHQLSISRR